MKQRYRQILAGLLCTLFGLPTQGYLQAAQAQTKKTQSSEPGSEQPVSREQTSVGQVPETEMFQRKGIAFYQRQPDYPLTRVLRQVLTQALPRFDYPLLYQNEDADLLEFFSQVKAYQQEHAGEIAAHRQTPDETIKFADQVITWSETLAVMNAVLAFSTDWSFTPISLSSPIATVIRENASGSFLGAPPSNVYSEIVTRIEEVEDKETKKKVEKEVRYLIYFRVAEQSTVRARLGLYDLAGSHPQLLRNWRDSWDLSISDNQHYITRADAAAASLSISDDRSGKSYSPRLNNASQIENLPRFQRMLSQQADVRFMSQASYTLDHEGAWSSLIQSLKQMDSLALKGQVSQIGHPRDSELITLDFGAETPYSLNQRLRDAYSLYETRIIDGIPQQVEIGFGRIRRMGDQTAQVEPLLLNRPVELGDLVKENLIGNASLQIGPQLMFTPRGPYSLLYIGGEFFEHVLSAKELNQLATNAGLSLEEYQQNLRPDWIDEQSITMGLALGHSLQRRVFTGEIDVGYVIKQAHQQWLWSGGLIGSFSIFRSSTEEADPAESLIALGIGPKLGLTWQQSPTMLFALNLGGRLALPYDASALSLELLFNAQW